MENKNSFKNERKQEESQKALGKMPLISPYDIAILNTQDLLTDEELESLRMISELGKEVKLTDNDTRIWIINNPTLPTFNANPNLSISHTTLSFFNKNDILNIFSTVSEMIAKEKNLNASEIEQLKTKFLQDNGFVQTPQNQSSIDNEPLIAIFNALNVLKQAQNSTVSSSQQLTNSSSAAIEPSNTISQIKSDEFFKREGERVYTKVHDRDRDAQKNEVSFKSGNWYNPYISYTHYNFTQNLQNNSGSSAPSQQLQAFTRFSSKPSNTFSKFAQNLQDQPSQPNKRKEEEVYSKNNNKQEVTENKAPRNNRNLGPDPRVSNMNVINYNLNFNISNQK